MRTEKGRLHSTRDVSGGHGSIVLVTIMLMLGSSDPDHRGLRRRGLLRRPARGRRRTARNRRGGNRRRGVGSCAWRRDGPAPRYPALDDRLLLLRAGRGAGWSARVPGCRGRGHDRQNRFESSDLLEEQPARQSAHLERTVVLRTAGGARSVCSWSSSRACCQAELLRQRGRAAKGTRNDQLLGRERDQVGVGCKRG